MVRYDWPRESALVGAQVIAPDGEKRFTPGTAKQGSAVRLGLVEVGAVVLLCEGLATGLTIRMALNNRFAVFVAFDAGNLRPVADMLRALYPTSPILVCADDDWQTKGNPGIAKATEVSKRVPYAHLIYPVFTGKRAAKDTDFNDLHVAMGLPVVGRQFQAPISYLGRLNVRPVEGLAHAA
jgi:putative DNA primase/helicase